MRALIMAGGFGKRLMPLTRKIPKALVKVGGKSILYWQIKWLNRNGIYDFIILGGYKASKLVGYVKSIGYSDRFEFSIEKKPLGSAGALRNAKNLLRNDGQFLVVNGDNITDIDISKLKLPGKAICCVSLKPYKSHAGVVQIRNNMVTYFKEKPVIKGYWTNLGITLIKNELLSELPKEGSLERDIFPKLIKQKRLACATYPHSYHRAVDTYKDYKEVDAYIRSGRFKV